MAAAAKSAQLVPLASSVTQQTRQTALPVRLDRCSMLLARQAVLSVEPAWSTRCTHLRQPYEMVRCAARFPIMLSITAGFQPREISTAVRDWSRLQCHLDVLQVWSRCTRCTGPQELTRVVMVAAAMMEHGPRRLSALPMGTYGQRRLSPRLRELPVRPSLGKHQPQFRRTTFSRTTRSKMVQGALLSPTARATTERRRGLAAGLVRADGRRRRWREGRTRWPSISATIAISW